MCQCLAIFPSVLLMYLPNSSTAAEDRFHVVLESVLILIPTFPYSTAFSMQYCIFHAVLQFWSWYK